MPTKPGFPALSQEGPAAGCEEAAGAVRPRAAAAHQGEEAADHRGAGARRGARPRAGALLQDLLLLSTTPQQPSKWVLGTGTPGRACACPQAAVSLCRRCNAICRCLSRL